MVQVYDNTQRKKFHFLTLSFILGTAELVSPLIGPILKPYFKDIKSKKIKTVKSHYKIELSYNNSNDCICLM